MCAIATIDFGKTAVMEVFFFFFRLLVKSVFFYHPHDDW